MFFSWRRLGSSFSVCYDEKMNEEKILKEPSIEQRQKNAIVWEEKVSHMPTHDELYCDLEPATREVGAGLSLAGFNVTKVSESGNGVDAYPHFVIEPIVKKEEWEDYVHLLKKKEEFNIDALSDPEQTRLIEMKEKLNAAGDAAVESLNMLLEKYYDSAERKEKGIEGIERLVTVQNPEGIVIVVPSGAYLGREEEAKKKPIAGEDERKHRNDLFAREMENFGKFLRLHFVGQ